jgi:hypothetical protein
VSNCNAHWSIQIQSPSNPARVYKIITSKGDALRSFIVLEQWTISAKRDEHYGMPLLHHSHEDTYFAVLPEVCLFHCLSCPKFTIHKKDIYFVFNAQHDCWGGGCELIEDRVLQDREKTSRTELHVKHSGVDCYFINLHAHHNAWRLRKVLPRDLTAPVPYTLDRKKLHTEAAQELQKKNPAKRAEVLARAKATRERNKKEAQMKE